MSDNFVINGTVNMGMNASDVLGSVKQIQGAFNGLKLPTNLTGNMLKDFDKLREVMTKIKDLSNKQTFNNADMKNLNKLGSQADSLFSKISNSIDELSGKQIYLEADLTKIKEVESTINEIKNKIQNELSNLKINIDAGDTSKSLGMDQIITDMEKGVKSSKVLSAAMQEVKLAITTGDFNKASQIFNEIEQKAIGLKGAGAGLLEIFRQWGAIDFKGPAKGITDTEEKSRLLNTAITAIINQLNTSNSSQVFKDLNKDLGDTTSKLESVKSAAEANYTNSMKGLASQVRDTGQAANKTTDEMKRMGQSTLDAANQIKQLQQSTQYFFGLRNMINLLRRGVSQAIDTIKELDKAMTETAVVVPEWNVGDMWAKLPEYTKNANALGSTVVDLYKATTLYYQQGLRGNEVMDIAAETMKMARIGGLEAADATDKMTAALRGFNMEISATSAQRVNDVYSNLAANTASNTEELGTAMQRTASIAASAGMSFEGTAAFLAQAIETTREPAENLGTAMKTIVARFTELKKNPLEIAEVDGEEVSYNKVDTALQSIGVSLKDTNGQFRNLDQVFLDISQRWDSLTQTQQRYIATTAAGSRQQSRFIAMMSNYQRTTELMDFANNSEGASQEQFEKTMESLEAKMNKLKNAWDKFLMGITDNQIIKGAVDGLTELIEGVNELINTLSFGIGPVKSFLSLMTAFVGLKMGGRILNSAIGGLGGLIDPTSGGFIAGMKGGALGKGNPTLASQIYTPIVAAIHQVSGKLQNKGGNPFMTAEQQRYTFFNNARKQLGNISQKGGTVNQVTSQFMGLNQKDQKTLVNDYRSTFDVASKGILKSYTKFNYKNKVPQEYERWGLKNTVIQKSTQIENKQIDAGLNATKKFLQNQVNAGEMSAETYFKTLKDPQLLREALNAVNTHSGGQYNAASMFMEGLNKQVNERADDMLINANKTLSDRLFNKKISQQQYDKAYDKLNSQESKERIRLSAAQQLLKPGQEKVELSATQKAFESVGRFGSAASAAGMGLQSFGSILQQSANPAISAFGTVISSIGGALSGFGMLLSGLVSALTPVVTAIGGLATAGLVAIPLLIGGLYAYKKINDKLIKQKAEEITANYKEDSKTHKDNINNLTNWQSELARLSKGVDKNGNNINLESSDYQQYLEIVDKIAEINPDIVKGYNAQGHAIINNNKALSETLKKEKELQQQITKEYTSKESMDAMIAARNLNKENISYGSSWRTVGKSKNRQSEYTVGLAPQADMLAQAKQMAAILQGEGFTSKDFRQFGIDLDALANGEQQAISKLQSNFNNFVTHSKSLMQSAGTEISEEALKTFDKAVKGYNTASDELDDLITPLYEQLSAKMSAEGVFNSIPEEMATYYNQGLKAIASDANLGTNEIIQQSRQLATEFENLTSKGTDYDKAMEKIAEAQEKFGEDLDIGAYDKAADGVIKDLNKIKDGVDLTTSYGQALTEFLDNQIAQIKNFTEEGEISISDALNTMTDEIAAAEGALESFKKVEEGSNFSTAAENMKEIYDTITEIDDKTQKNKHSEGLGDQTYWAGAESLLGRNNLKDQAKKDVDDMLKTIKPMLEEGKKGFDAFYQHWIANKEELDKIEGVKLFDNGMIDHIDDVANPEVFAQISDQLNISEELLTSMLNKGRQFGAIDFDNLEKVREGLATSDSIIAGQRPKDNKTKRNLYIKEETLNAEFANAGIVEVNRQEKYRKQLETEQNVKVITEAAKIGIKEFQDMGIHSQESLINILGETGQFTKEEIQEYAERYAKVNENAAKFNKEDFNNQFKAYEAVKDPVAGAQLKSLESLDASVATVVDILSDQRIEEGHLDKSLGKDLWNMVVGKKGKIDTEAQLFSRGLNKEGNLISRKEAIETGKNMKSLIAENEEYLTRLKEGRSKTKAGSEDRKKFDNEIKTVESINKYLSKIYNNRQDSYHKANDQKIAEINERNKGLLKGKTWEDFKGKEKGNALDRLYGITEPLTEITDSFEQDLEILGLTVEKAKNKGLVTKEAYKEYEAQQKEKDKQDEEIQRQRREKAHKTADKNIETINEKTGNLLEGKTWKDFKGKNNRIALEEIAQATQEPVQIITDGFMNSLATVGLNLEQALDKGLISKPAYDIWKQKAEANELARQQAKDAGEQEADDESLEGVRTKGKDSQKKRLGKKQEGEDEADSEYHVIPKPKPTIGSPNIGNFEEAGKKIEDAGDEADKTGDKIHQAAVTTEEAATQNELYSRNTAKIGEAFSSFIKNISNGLSGLTKSAKEFNETTGSSPSLQGKPKQKGTTIPGVGFVPSDKKKPDESTPKDQSATFTITADYTQVTEAKKEIKTVIKTAKKGATIPVKANIGKSLEKAQQALDTLKSSSGQKVSSSVKVSSTGDTSGIKTITKAASSAKSSVLVTANTGPAYQKVNSLISSINNKTANVDVNVWPHYKGTWKKEIYVSKTGPGAKNDYLGQNNTGRIPQLPNMGSAAIGTSRLGTGRLGPKGKGGLTLTGELGYEVAWLPRQNRSMILGEKGPEMVNLPGDAVVWNHEQSKQIIKKNAIPSGSAWIGAGSAGDGDYVHGNPDYKLSNPEKNKNKDKKKKEHKYKNDDKTDKKRRKNVDKAEKLIANSAKIASKAGKISVWWENISKQISTAQRLANKNQTELQKLLKRTGTTISDISSTSAKYRQYLNKQITLNQKVVNEYTDQLTNLLTNNGKKGNGTGKEKYSTGKKVKNANKAQKTLELRKAEYEVAKDTKSKKDDKKAKAAYNKAKHNADKKKNKLSNVTKGSIKTVSYEDTVEVKTKKGKKTKTKKQKVKTKRAVDFSKILYEDEDGNILINKKAVNKAAGKTKNGKVNKKAAEAIRDKAEKIANEKQKRRDEAQDNIDAAKDKLEELSQEVYDTFYGWKNELTQIANLTQKIADLSADIEKFESYQTLIDSMIGSGLYTSKQMSQMRDTKGSLYTAQLSQNIRQIEETQKALNLQRQNLVDILNLKDKKTLQAQLEKYIEKNTGVEGKKEQVENAEENKKILDREIQILTTAKAYLKGSSFNSDGTINLDFDWKQLEEDRFNPEKGINEATYTEIKNLYDSVVEGNKEVFNSLNELANNAEQLYTSLKSLQETYASYADELLQAYEETKQEEIDELNSLSDVISNNIKDILDVVKENIEKRRQTEDNLKTETDISKKQQRLATLRADTSGGNATSIKQLEQEIAEAQQSYGRTLEDQLLDTLQKQGEEAVRQRETQIRLLQAQYELNKITGANAAQISKYLASPDSFKAQIASLWEKSKNYVTSSEQTQELLRAEFGTFWNDISPEYGGIQDRIAETKKVIDLIDGLETNTQGKVSSIEEIVGGIPNGIINGLKPPIQENASTINAGTQTANEINASSINVGVGGEIGKVDKSIGNVDKSVGETNSSIGSNNASGIWGIVSEINADAKAKKIDDILAEQQRQEELRKLAEKERLEKLKEATADKNNQLIGTYLDTKLNNDRETLQKTLNELEQSISELDLGDDELERWDARLKELEDRINALPVPTKEEPDIHTKAIDIAKEQNPAIAFKYGTKEEKKEILRPAVETVVGGALQGVVGLLKKFRSHASGGMNYTTGPAWLDGTRAKPEAVLNATDTKNFIALKDVLSNAMNGVSSIQTSNVESGPVTYDIDINVDHLNNDYDVDKVAKRVEKIITQDSSYRNVTLVRKFR